MAKYYYNGVLLPEIPADVLAQYPNVFVYKWQSDGAINFIAAPSEYKWYYAATYGQIRITECTYVRYKYDTETGLWTLVKTHTDNGRWGLGATGELLWSSHDIPNGSATSTTIYFYGNYPIPEAGECYYNGVRLPAIPADKFAAHTNQMIVKWPNGNIQLIGSKNGLYFNGNTGAYDKGNTTLLAYNLSEDTWVEDANQSGKYTGWTIMSNGVSVLHWSNHDIRNGSATSTTIYFYGNSPVAVEPETPTERTRGYLVRSGSTLYTITDGALTALVETEITASLFQTYGVDALPDGSLLVGLTDPEVLYWQDSTDELPTLSMTVNGTPPLPQVFTSEPMDLTHESIAGIDHASVDASEDVRFAISFDDGASWQAFDGSAWFNVSDTAPGMLASTMKAITVAQWAEVVQLTAYRLRFWLPNVTAFVKSVVIHYINP